MGVEESNAVVRPALLAACAATLPPAGLGADDPPRNAASDAVLLDLPGTGTDPDRIAYDKLPAVPVTHAVVSAGDEDWKFRLHSYLARHGGKFWCMWSHGPVVEDVPTQHVRYATSDDGLKWSEPKVLIPPPKEPYAYIARGFWVRDGRTARPRRPLQGQGGVRRRQGTEARSLRLRQGGRPVDVQGGGVRGRDQQLPAGEAAGRRVDDDPPGQPVQRVHPDRRGEGARRLAVRPGGGPAEGGAIDGFSPDEPIWWAQPDKTLVALFRDNGGSGRLFRSTSADDG